MNPLSMAFLVLLEQLTPLERAVFLLREIFGYDYAEIATILDKTDSACRQVFSRAKKYIHEHRPRFTAPPADKRCDSCRFFKVAKVGSACVGCQIVSGPIAAPGYCNYWVVKKTS